MTGEMTHTEARPFTYEDLKEMPDDGYRREIIGGSLIVTPSPTGRHQRVVVRLVALLAGIETPEAVVMIAPYDWKLPGGESVEPDLLVISRADYDAEGPLPQTAVPRLVVEVLSPSNAAYDRVLKRELYERIGVPAYWIIDPVGPSLLALRLRDARYRIEYEGSGTFRAEYPLAVDIPVASLADLP